MDLQLTVVLANIYTGRQVDKSSPRPLHMRSISSEKCRISWNGLMRKKSSGIRPRRRPEWDAVWEHWLAIFLVLCHFDQLLGNCSRSLN